MISVDLVFVVLTYINDKDLSDFLESLKKVKGSYATIVVDAFYSEECSARIKEITYSYGAVYRQIENKGYSYGNNFGISVANEIYNYQFLIISNPDVVIKDLDVNMITELDFDVLGPDIVNKKNKKQNPMYYSSNSLARRLVYIGLKNNNKTAFFGGIIWSKISRFFWSVVLNKKMIQDVFQVHGCFMVFTANFVRKTGEVFDDNMFLFAEESFLAWKVKQMKGRMVYNKHIRVLHKEDGSMKFAKQVDDNLRNSNIYVFEKYYNMK